MSADRLAEIRARADAATPAQWVAGHNTAERHSGVTSFGPGFEGAVIADVPSSIPDAEFIAHAREDVPYLLAEVERLRAETSSRTMRNQDDLDRAEAECDIWRDRWRQLMRDHEATTTERDRAEAAVARVRGLADESRYLAPFDEGDEDCVLVADLQLALTEETK